MYVRVNYGVNAGKIIDMRPDIAQELLRSGRASDPRFEKRPEVRPEVTVSSPNPETGSATRKRRLSRSN